MDKKELPPLLREDNLTEETKILISSLPSDKELLGNIYKYKECWYYANTLQGILNLEKGFKPEETDIILASFPKSGTTWLKALIVALLQRSKNPSSFDDNHPLKSNNPHHLVPNLEMDLYLNSLTPDLSKLTSSPRLLSTHMPLQPPYIDSPCKIVYVCRDVKDVLVSYLHFRCAYLEIEVERSHLQSMFESFCSGVGFFGPFWEHVLSYWRGSLEDPKHVLFMRYEELKAEPFAQVKRPAEFLDCPFTKEEEESGSVDKVIELCSLSYLSGLEINKTGKSFDNVSYSVFFRKGEVGDSKNHLTPQMENKIDMIITEKFKGSGLKF